MTQYMRPSSDIAGNWTGTYADINEITPDDSDYIRSPLNNQYEEYLLSTPNNEPNNGLGVLRFRGCKENTNTGSITPSIRVGSTVIKTGSSLSMTTSFAEYTLTLSEAEMANITDWTDVRVRFLCTTSSNYVRVSWAVFEVPDENAVGLEMGCSF